MFSIKTRDVDPEELPQECKEALNFFFRHNWVKNTKRDSIYFRDAETDLSPIKACCFVFDVEGANAATLERILNDDPTFSDPTSNQFKIDLMCETRCRLPLPGASAGSIVLLSHYDTPSSFISKREFVGSMTPGIYLSPKTQEFFGYHFNSPLSRTLLGFEPLPPRSRSAPPDPTARVFMRGVLDAGKYHPEVKKKFVRAKIFHQMFSAVDDPSSMKDVPLAEMKWAGSQAAWTTQEQGLWSELTARVATRCRVIFFYSMDPCGSVPAFAVNATSARQIDGMIILRDLMKKIGPQVPMRSGATIAACRSKTF